MERFEAKAIYESGQGMCVDFLLMITGAQAGFEDRIEALGQVASASSRTSARAPSTDVANTRQQRWAKAREKAKELARRDGKPRQQGAQDGHQGVRRKLRPEDQIDEIVDLFPDECSGCGREFTEPEKLPRCGPGRHQVADLHRPRLS